METLFLKHVPLFKHISESNLNSIIKVLKTHVYKKNEIVFIEGDQASRLYIVFDGKIKIFKSSIDGKEHTLHIMHKYDIIGEVPMFDGGKYPASCTTLSSSVLLSITHSDLLNIIKQYPKIALNMLAFQAVRLRKFALKIENLTLQNTEQRLAIYFMQKAENSINNQAVVILKNIGLQNLSNYLGVSRENISRILSKWIKMDFINKQHGNIVINNFCALKSIVDHRVK